ncbi:MAG: NAD(P)H-dependent oxidoreductase [Phycisphaerae bacterium]|nr:NAD(P)H-dependent oxidoreductase [Phycisphaerae bacterium]
MPATKLLAFSGSSRRASFNALLVRAAAASARDVGAEITVIDLREFVMPLYDGDLEASEGLPANTVKLKEIMKAHQGLLLSCPEYNSSMSPLLCNTIAWCSRPAAGESPLVCFQGKVAGLLSASPGALGGLRGLVAVRSLLSNIGVHVIPTQFALAKAHEAFNADGTLKDEKHAAAAKKVAAEVTRVAGALNR